MATRPEPPENQHAGYHFEAVEEGSDWQCADEPRTCRRMNPLQGWRCPSKAVAKFLRKGRKRSQWWYYCEEHMYDRWVENGKVMSWRLVEDQKQLPEATHAR